MRPTLLESGWSFLQSAECAVASLVAHAGLVWLAVAMTVGGSRVPADEREARVFFLLPPDRVDVRQRQTESIKWGSLGSDLANGTDLARVSEGLALRERTYGARKGGKWSGARG